MRLKGQKQVVESRMKYDDQQHRLWRKQWNIRFRDLTKQSAELQRQTQRQDKLLQRKAREADRSARKVEELRREQQQHIATMRQRVQVDREVARAARVREANARLQRELEEREEKVQRMEAMLAERLRLQGLGTESLVELEAVEEHIETLDAQIEFDSECIAQSQTDILHLTSATGAGRGGGRRGSQAGATE